MKFNTLRVKMFAGLGTILMLGLAPATGQSQGALKQVTILSTGSGNGEVAPCG